MKRKNFLKASILAPVLALFGISRSEAKVRKNKMIIGSIGGQYNIELNFYDSLPQHCYNSSGIIKADARLKIGEIAVGSAGHCFTFLCNMQDAGYDISSSREHPFTYTLIYIGILAPSCHFNVIEDVNSFRT